VGPSIQRRCSIAWAKATQIGVVVTNTADAAIEV
jgi:hypothetical protein